MSERIDELQYTKDEEGKQVQEAPFYNGPGEFLVQCIAHELKKIEVWTQIFGQNIDAYMRMDYSMRALPVLRIYNLNQTKNFDSWFVEGDIKADILFPASLRRNETQQIQDTMSAALMQQFRRPGFFSTLCEAVPGLNELGKRFDVDKSLGFDFEDAEVPLTQITLNFRLDLRIWDEYLADTNRTKDSPFNPVLGDLKSLVTTIQGMRDDDETVEVEIDANINTTGE